MSKKLVSRSEFARLAEVSPAAVTKACSGPLKAASDGKRIDAAHPDAVAYMEKRAAAKRPDPGPAPAEGIDPLYEDAVRIYQGAGGCSIYTLRKELKIGFHKASKLHALILAAGVSTNREPQPKKPHVRGHAARNEKKKRDNPPPDPETYADTFPDDIAAYADMTLRELVERFGTEVAFKDWLDARKRIEDIRTGELKNAENQGRLISRTVVKTGIIDTLDAAFTRMLTDGTRTIATRAQSLTQAGASAEEIERMIEDQIGSFIRPTKSKIARVLRNA